MTPSKGKERRWWYMGRTEQGKEADVCDLFLLREEDRIGRWKEWKRNKVKEDVERNESFLLRKEEEDEDEDEDEDEEVKRR